MCWPYKDGFWTISTLGRNGHLEGADFGLFSPGEGVVVFKGLIFNSVQVEGLSSS